MSAEITIAVQPSTVTVTPEEGPSIEVAVGQPTVTISDVGTQGPPGPSGASYDHVQAVASSTWTIPHNLGFFPAVDVFTVGGLKVLADVQHLSTNTAVVTLLAPMAGSARLT